MRSFSMLCLALVLTACGGGGGDATPAVGNAAPTPPPVVATAAGFWTGTASDGASVQLVILEDGQTWGIESSGNLILGALNGITASSGTKLSGSGRAFDLVSQTTSAATYTGTFVANSNISLTTSNGDLLTATYVASYDQPASLTAIAGNFQGTGVTGTTNAQAVPVSISTTGVVTVPTSQGCGATGTATPRSSGKNIFDVSVTFNGANCALGNGAVTTGVAYFDTATRRLLVLALNAAKTDGFIYVGQK